MKRLLLLSAAAAVAATLAGLARPQVAQAGWCWPGCNSYGTLTSTTSTNNGCWYTFGEVCSGWAYWTLNSESKLCDLPCTNGVTKGRILYGFENSQHIRGKFTYLSGTRRIAPSEVSLGGMYLRAQISWWFNPDYTPSAPSAINAAAIG